MICLEDTLNDKNTFEKPENENINENNSIEIPEAGDGSQEIPVSQNSILDNEDEHTYNPDISISPKEIETVTETESNGYITSDQLAALFEEYEKKRI